MRKSEKNKMSFEDALVHLEEAAGALERGDLPLAELLKTFEDGMEYVEICQQRLQKAEDAMDKVLQREQDKIIEMPLVLEEEENV